MAKNLTSYSIGTTESGSLLLEDGFFLLLEDGSNLTLDTAFGLERLASSYNNASKNSTSYLPGSDNLGTQLNSSTVTLADAETRLTGYEEDPPPNLTSNKNRTAYTRIPR